MAPNFLRAAALVFAAAVSVDLSAARLVIAGAVFEDRLALAVRPHFVPSGGVTIRVYRDMGDREPSADDVPAGTAQTDEHGVYLVPVAQKGDYWVVVDSRSIGGGRGWAEQTFGPAGSRCARPDGTMRVLSFEGSCFGGQGALRSDDATTLAGAEHLALVTLGEPATGVDFAFSFDVVVTTADAEAVQGSLRQFLRNAAAIPGPNRMRFVPVETAPEQRETTFGVPPRWWRLTAGAPLPEISDADTIVDGTAYNFLSAASPANAHPGRVGEAATFKPGERRTVRIEKADLELLLSGEQGLVCSARCGIRGVALHGSAVGIVARAAVQLEDVMIGAAPDAAGGELPGRIGLHVERETTTARKVLVGDQTTAGILVAREARLDGEVLEVTRCGTLEGGAGVVLFSNGSSLRGSNIAANHGAGIILGALDGSAPATGNTIDSCTISANQAGVVFAPGSSRNSLTRNDIIWNRFGGVTVAPHEDLAVPRENRLSANRFDENGLRPVLLDLDRPDPNELVSGVVECRPDETRPNRGILPPRIEHVRFEKLERTARALIRGRACPGQTIEIYQSFVTWGLREEKTAELPRVRGSEGDQLETITSQERTRALPSIGEFNYIGATATLPDGTFQATFELPLTITLERSPNEEEETKVWATDVLRAGDSAERAFSAMAVDPAGNTSEMSVRRTVDDVDRSRSEAKP